jgi:hypothetical protein
MAMTYSNVMGTQSNAPGFRNGTLGSFRRWVSKESKSLWKTIQFGFLPRNSAASLAANT